MKRKSLIVAIPLIILVLISSVLGIYCYNEIKKINNYFEGETISSILAMVDSQEDINTKLDNIANDKRYTFDKAYVELNPYKISPLSAIIIFQTKNEESVDVILNDKLITSMEKSKKHIIPIYGLLSNYENKVRLIIGSDTKEYIIKTEKSNIKYPLEVIEKKESINNEDIYFTVASYETWLTGWDKEGNLRFYLTEDMRMDVEWLDNGHFIIGTSQGQFAENFVGFVEMDYLGKVYNYYTLEHGFSFESQILSNGNIMSAGGEKPVYINKQYVYELDPTTGETISEVNLYDVFKNVDPEFDDKYLGQAAIRNGFYYDEKNDDLIVSFRGINTIFCVSYKEKKLKWIFTNPDNEVFASSVWDSYKIKSKSGDYPWGQHSPVITSDGNIALFNNGYDRFHGFEVGGKDSTRDYLNNYSRAEIYKIEDGYAKLIWNYDGDKKYFSHQYGSINFYEDNKLVNFGYILKDEYRKKSTSTLSEAEMNPDNIYSLIIELDKNDNVIFKAKCEEGKYRAFKHSLYNKTTKNVDVKTLNIFNSIKNEPLKEKMLKDFEKLEKKEWINSLEFTKNTFKTNYSIQENDEIKLYFVNKTGKTYIMTYKDSKTKQLNRIFNLELNTGKYSMYIELNGEIYDPMLNVIYK